MATENSSTTPIKGWRLPPSSNSLPEVHGSIAIPEGAGFWRKLFAFAGPGYLVAVGYMDPGNWATDLAGGARFGYTLLSVIMMSNLMAILLQALAARLGIASGRDLAQACRDQLLASGHRRACGCSAKSPSPRAISPKSSAPRSRSTCCSVCRSSGASCLTALDVLVVLYLQHRGFRYVEALVVGLILADRRVVRHRALSREAGSRARCSPASSRGPTIVRNPEMLYIAIGILGATVMPHNLYLHSSIVQTRKYHRHRTRASARRSASRRSIRRSR